MVQKAINKLSENPFISDFVRSMLLFSISKNSIKKLITIDNNESILELGCGTGRFSTVFDSHYIGSDIDVIHIQHAHKKYHSPKKQFVITNGKGLSFKENSFDKSTFIQSLHHVDDNDSIIIFKEMSRVTKEDIYIVDWLPFKYNIFGKYLQKNDRGKYIRTFEEQKNLIGRVLEIKNAYTSRSGQITSSYFICKGKE